MDRGIDFLKAQVNNAVAQHEAFLDSLEDHEAQAEDPRFRNLCSNYIPTMRAHQAMLEAYQHELGAHQSGLFKKTISSAFGTVRDLADTTRQSDFLRLVADIVMSRQAEDTFKTFREAGRQLAIPRLAHLGDAGEHDHDSFSRDANRLVQQLFVEHVRDGDFSQATAETTTGTTAPPPESRP